MSNVIFFHDHKFIFHKGKYYTSGQLTDETLSRYTSFCSKLVVFCRKIESKSDFEIDKYNEVTDKKVEFKCISPWSFLEGLFSIKIKNQIRREIIYSDVVVCRLPSYLGFLAFSIANKLKKKTICEVVGCPWDSYNNHGSYLAKILAPFVYGKMKLILRKSKYNIYVTKNFLQKRYPTKGKVCVASNVFIGNHNIRADIKRCCRKIMFIGSLNTKYKGLQDLILAMSYLEEELELHILGSGDSSYYYSLAKRLGIEKKLHFHEPLPGGKDVLKWLSRGDIYVHPSHTEGLPRSLIEAMSVGLPCIGTTVGGIPELLQDNCRVPPKQPEKLSKKLLEFIENPRFRHEESKANLSKSKEYESGVLSKRRHDFLKTSLF